jgi:2-oxoglutarate ferredoxin oxidoreductase subunit alpha
MSKKVIDVEQVVVKFAGDSGDGMQLTGTQFSDTTALEGNDLSTFPDYPAEIRAPQGTVGGVSGFQLHFGKIVNTPGDFCDVLIAMNPAALNANKRWLKEGGTIIIDIDQFTERNLEKAGFKTNPVEEFAQEYNLIEAPITELTKACLKDSGLDAKAADKSKNMFALGIVYNIFGKTLSHTESFFEYKFKSKPDVILANKAVLHAGYNYAEAIEALPSYRVHMATIAKGLYRNINGNTATAWGLLAAAEKANLPFFLGSYPITPATDILQEIAHRKDLGAKSFQAEDEIGGIMTSIGAAFTGHLAATSTSGPGLALKTEAIGLAVITELPLVVVDVQRGGPSTGLPTKTEQSDLFQAIFGRNGESPVPVIAASTPSNCFQYAFESAKIALEHMTPVLLLTDNFLANGSEPWKIPAMKDMPAIKTKLIPSDSKEYKPYQRDENLVRPWAVPGMKGFEHRIGGLEKMDVTGTVSYVPENHELMTKYRDEKVKKLVDFIPAQEVEGDKDADFLIVGWGSTYGHITTAVRELQAEGMKIAHAQFNYINPLPKNTGDVLKKYKKILVCELNLGQFANYLRMRHPENEYQQFTKVQGLPFTVAEIKKSVNKIKEGK